MRQLFLAFLFCLLTSTAFAQEGVMGLHCGTRGTLLGSIASDFLIPDYFPPENLFLRLLLFNPFFIDLSSCEETASVFLGQSCSEHDQCYATLGAVKDDCDSDLFAGWMQSCNDAYNDSFNPNTTCLNACITSISMMHAGMRFNQGGFCPSCIAFERAQERAR